MLYSGSYKFGNHCYLPVDDPESSGEEFECATAINLLPQIKRWVRNLERRRGAFRLPVATGKFYRDLVAELEDGRLFVIEYKESNLATNLDSRQKR